MKKSRASQPEGDPPQMNVTNIIKSLNQARKLLQAANDLAGAADQIKQVVVPALPHLKIPRLRKGSPSEDAKKIYSELVEELKQERAAHEQTRQHLRWATNEIENVKEAMRQWQKKALTRSPNGRKRRRKRQ